MKHTLAILPLSALLLAACSGSTNSGSSSIASSGSEEVIITFDEAFCHIAGNIGLFTLTFDEESAEDFFLEKVDEETLEGITLGDAFSDMTLYSMVDTGENVLQCLTLGDLKTGYDYGTVSGRGITEKGGDFSVIVSIVEPTLTCEGSFYNGKEENTITLTLENAAFHGDISVDDLTLGGGLEGATITSIVPDEDTLLADDSGTLDPDYQRIAINFSGVESPEEYGYITVLDSGITYNKDLLTSFDFLRESIDLITPIETFDLSQSLLFTFSNVNLDQDISKEDIEIGGELEGTVIDSLSIIEFADYGRSLQLNVTYPATFFEKALDGGYDALEGSFSFSEKATVEGRAMEVYCSLPRPDIDDEHSYDATTRKVTNTLTFNNGRFDNSALAIDDFSYLSGTEAIAIADASFSLLSDNVLSFSCTMPEGFEGGLLSLKINDLFEIHYSASEEVGYFDYSRYQYLA